MIVCFVLIIGIAALLLFSVQVQLPKHCQPLAWQKAFYRAAYYLLQQFAKRNRKVSATAFMIERVASVLLVLFLGAGLSLLMQIAMTGTGMLIDGYELSRPSEQEGERSQELQVQIGELQTEQMEIVIAKRRYTDEEKQAFLERAMEELETIILGENVSPDEVRGRVILPTVSTDGHVTIVWMQEPIGLLDEDGYITETLPEEGEVLQLKAMLTCEDREMIYECALQLLPPNYSAAEKMRRALEEEVKKADEQSAKESILRLPKEVDGQRLVWQETGTSVIGFCLMLTVFAAVCVWLGKNQELQKKEELRKRQMILDYPDLLFKMSMLLNAGLTMQNAFFKIALEYRNRKTDEVHYAYEEMLKAYYEMNSGVPEARAYENFGRRCGGNSYIKLGSMLSSNLQKGSQGLAGLLQDLAQNSMEERRQMAKKLGEEAGTKLLMPMVLMLLVVLVILMMPAMMAF